MILRKRRLRRQLRRAHERAVRPEPDEIYMPSLLSPAEQFAIWDRYARWRGPTPSR